MTWARQISFRWVAPSASTTAPAATRSPRPTDVTDHTTVKHFADKHLMHPMHPMHQQVSRTFDNVPCPAPTSAQIPWTAS
jgi:hypothetical protein